MDSLEITGLSVATRIGVHQWEQRISQRLFIDIHVPSDFKHCEDEIQNTIDYSELCQKVIEFAESKVFKLIETVANDVALFIKETYKVNEVTVSVSKPHAVKSAVNVKVTVKR